MLSVKSADLSFTSGPSSLPNLNADLHTTISNALPTAIPMRKGLFLSAHNGAPVLIIDNPVARDMAFELHFKKSQQITPALELAAALRTPELQSTLFKLNIYSQSALRNAINEHPGFDGEQKAQAHRATIRMLDYIGGRSSALAASSVSIVVLTADPSKPYIFLPAPLPELIVAARASFEQKVKALQSNAGKFELRTSEIARIERGRMELDRFEKVVTSWANGATVREIRREHTISAKTVERWIEGQIPADILAVDSRTPSGRRARTETITLPRQESPEWAYLLGAYQAVTSHRGIAVGFRATFPDQAPIRKLAETIEALNLGLRVVSGTLQSHGLPRHYVRVASIPLSKALHSLTGGNEHIAWEALGTRAEQLEFMRGYLSMRGDMSMGVFRLSIAQHRRLAMELAGLFNHLGVHVALGLGKDTGIRIASHTGLSALSKLGVLRPDLQRDVDEHLAHDTEPRYYDESDRQRVNTHFERFPHSTLAFASQQTEIPAAVIGSWRKGEKLPNLERMKAQLNLDALEIPNPEVAAALYRRFDLPISECRSMALKFTIEQIRQALRQLESTARASPEVELQVFRSRLERAAADTKPAAKPPLTPYF